MFFLSLIQELSFHCPARRVPLPQLLVAGQPSGTLNHRRGRECPQVLDSTRLTFLGPAWMLPSLGGEAGGRWRWKELRKQETQPTRGFLWAQGTPSQVSSSRLRCLFLGTCFLADNSSAVSSLSFTSRLSVENDLHPAERKPPPGSTDTTQAPPHFVHPPKCCALGVRGSLTRVGPETGFPVSQNQV